MRRIFLPGELAEAVRITGRDAHHLMHSMRAKAGQRIVAVDSARRVGLLELVSFGRDAVTARLLERLEDRSEPALELCLAQSLPKGDKMELIVQKAVELGASFIQPLQAQNSVVRLEGKRLSARLGRWQAVADEAAKQCGRAVRPQVAPVLRPEEWLAGLEEDPSRLLLFCHEKERRRTLRQCLGGDVRRAWVAIGPEGGFSPGEAALLESRGALAITLGPRVLRTETAAIAAMALLQYELGDMGL